MKKLLCILLCLVLLAGCAAPAPGTEPEPITAGEVPIRLSDAEIEFPADSGIHLAQEPTFTRVCITAPGVYRLTGSIAAGQIFVDLGEQAANDPKSAVVLILDGAEILCRTAPAILFSNVYEGGQPDSPTGAHILLAQGSGNRIAGSHTEEFDGAVYSRMSMKLSGTGSLRIDGDNEGLCSERHLTIDGGTIHITSGNDGINTNADGISVTTINGGTLLIEVTGSTGEGDGIDSNGALVINGGYVESYACADSGDFGLDADLGVQINGGTVIATGNMLDRIADGGQTYAAFSFAQRQTPGTYTLKNAAGETALELTAVNDFQYLLLSAPALTAGTFTLWSGDTQFQGIVGQGGGFFGKIEPIERPGFPGKDDGDVEIPPQPTQPIVTHGTVRPSDGELPENMPVPPLPEGSENMPVPPQPQGGEDMSMPQLPGGVEPPQDGFGRQPVLTITGTLSTEFPIHEGANHFMQVQPAA